VIISCCKNDNPLTEIPVVTIGEIQDITDNKAVCGGNNLSDGGSAITKCGVCWDTDSSLLLIEKARYIQDLYDTGSFKSSITNLSPNTKYFVRAYASNKCGTGYGTLYSWKAVNSDTLCPVGWHVPSKDEWYTLTLSMDPSARDNGMEFNSKIAAGRLKETGVTHWNDPNTGATNTRGFTAVPGGLRGGYPKICDSISFVAYYFTSTGGHSEATGATPGISFQLLIRLDFDTEALSLSYKTPT
jgi:uncharacterized protein (TIGR02145 family)